MTGKIEELFEKTAWNTAISKGNLELCGGHMVCVTFMSSALLLHDSRRKRSNRTDVGKISARLFNTRQRRSTPDVSVASRNI